MMLNQQSTPSAYPNLRQKLQPILLTEPEIAKALSGLPPDTATIYLCQCLTEEDHVRRRREQLTFVILGIALVAGLTAVVRGELIQATAWPIFLFGILLIVASVWLSLRRFGVLRDNALIGLTQVILDVREREALVPLCRAAALLDGKKRPFEAEIEGAIRAMVARLLTRLSADEAALLPDETRQFLLSAITDGRHQELTVAALLTLGSARDSTAKSIAEELRGSLVETVREAALEYLQEVRDVS